MLSFLLLHYFLPIKQQCHPSSEYMTFLRAFRLQGQINIVFKTKHVLEDFIFGACSAFFSLCDTINENNFAGLLLLDLITTFDDVCQFDDRLMIG